MESIKQVTVDSRQSMLLPVIILMKIVGDNKNTYSSCPAVSMMSIIQAHPSTSTCFLFTLYQKKGNK